jgi:hypothetical protein
LKLQRGDLALITGASSGIGATYARHLAAAGANLILVARRRERLDALATELQQQHNVTVEVIVADLSQRADIDAVAQRIQELDRLALLINNAGFGLNARFLETEVARQVAMVDVHVTASLCLCHAALPRMIAQRRGAIVNVSSIAAFIPLPGNANYAATKAYLVTFSQALHSEVARHGVTVQALCPGFTYTEFHDTPEYRDFERSQVPKSMWMSADDIVTASLRALQRRRALCIPGWKYRVLAGLMRNSITGSGLLAVMRKMREGRG